MNQLEQVLRSLLEMKKIQVISTADESISSRKDIIESYSVQSQDFQAKRIEEVAKLSSRSDDSAAKQLTTYQSWMSTAELISNEESDKKPAKEKDTISHTAAAVVHLHLWSLGVLTAAGCGIGSVHEVNNEVLHLQFVSAARKFLKYFKCAAADLVILFPGTNKWYHSRTGFSLDELSGCASLGQIPSFYFRCAVRSLGARLSDKHMGRDRRMKNLSCSLYWFFIDLSNSVARVI
ncbi:myosin heavy chain-related family protein [Dorcoceras hygrometricum]|uniref:Myosin heavy chain-related family protein n=1 Tax=Dorcoceras hygrometricum TaxID=472368 RepID=A0A2Z7BL29_9LAMI|nr:myosin heavy chain-related family protein [Dorcoceras hygrometricum]